MAFNFVAGKKQKVIISQNCFSFLFTIKIPHKPDSRLKWFPELLSNPGDVSMATGGGSATLWVWLERCNVLLLFYGSGVSKPPGSQRSLPGGKGCLEFPLEKKLLLQPATPTLGRLCRPLPFPWITAIITCHEFHLAKTGKLTPPAWLYQHWTMDRRVLNGFLCVIFEQFWVLKPLITVSVLILISGAIPRKCIFFKSVNQTATVSQQSGHFPFKDSLSWKSFSLACFDLFF